MLVAPPHPQCQWIVTSGLSQGFLEVLGRLLGKKTTLYFYPAPDDDHEGELLTLEKVRIDEYHIHILIYLLEKGQVIEIEDFDEESVKIWSRKVVASIKKGDDEWKSMVPNQVQRWVKKHPHLF